MSDQQCPVCKNTGEVFDPQLGWMLWCECYAGHLKRSADARTQKQKEFEQHLRDDLKNETGKMRIFELIKEVTGQDICLAVPTTTEGMLYPW